MYLLLNVRPSHNTDSSSVGGCTHFRLAVAGLKERLRVKAQDEAVNSPGATLTNDLQVRGSITSAESAHHVVSTMFSSRTVQTSIMANAIKTTHLDS